MDAVKIIKDARWRLEVGDITREQYEELIAPLRDVETVRHGRWVHHPEIGWGSTYLCSECGEKTVETIMGEPRYKFCPMCGADMRGDGDD